MTSITNINAQIIEYEKKIEDITIDHEQEDFKQRLELLEQRKVEESKKSKASKAKN